MDLFWDHFSTLLNLHSPEFEVNFLKLVQTCFNLSQIIQTCLILSKWVQTCSNWSKTYFLLFTIFFTGLAIINEHSGLEGSGIEESGLDDIDELHPKYLPRKDMLNLLVDLLIFNSSQSAVTALIAVCKSASDKPGILLSFIKRLQT